MVQWAGVTGAFGCFRERVNAPAGRSHSIQRQIVPGQIRRPIRIAVPDHLPIGDGLLVAPPRPVRVHRDGQFLDLLDQLPGGQFRRSRH
jgi:hypothetical protein